MANKEIKVYVLNASSTDINFREAEKEAETKSPETFGHGTVPAEIIMGEAERLGSVYSLQGFQNAINDEVLDLSNSFIWIE